MALTLWNFFPYWIGGKFGSVRKWIRFFNVVVTKCKMSQELTARFWQTSSQSFLYSGSPGEINLSDKYLRPKYHISTFSHSDPYTFNAKRSKARIPCFYVNTQYFSIIFLYFYRQYMPNNKYLRPKYHISTFYLLR